ncbi:TPA: hypothetical protein P0E18_004480 [Vibrio harveyi]|nr:hypothetical protein [Vibrio harveyi]
MKAINVERDKYGMWTHPDLPVWGENTSSEQAEAWFASKGLTHHLVLMDDELGERWGKGELESCAEWQPEPRAKDSFLVGIWDSEDGVVAMFARPLKEDEMLTQEMIDVIHDCGWEIEDALPIISALRLSMKKNIETVQDATINLRDAIQAAEPFGLVRGEGGTVITGALASEHGVILVRE